MYQLRGESGSAMRSARNAAATRAVNANGCSCVVRADEDAPQSDEGQRRCRVGKGDDRGMTRYADAAALLGARPRRAPALCCHSSFTAVATACLSLDRGTMPLTGELASLGRVGALVLWPAAIAHAERRSCCLVDRPRTVCLSCPAVSQPEPRKRGLRVAQAVRVQEIARVGDGRDGHGARRSLELPRAANDGRDPGLTDRPAPAADVEGAFGSPTRMSTVTGTASTLVSRPASLPTTTPFASPKSDRVREHVGCLDRVALAGAERCLVDLQPKAEIHRDEADHLRRRSLCTGGPAGHRGTEPKRDDEDERDGALRRPGSCRARTNGVRRPLH